MKKLFFVLYSVLFLVGCGDMPGLNFGPYEPMSECPDNKAMNFNIIDCYGDSVNGCPWETNEDCIYCEETKDGYATGDSPTLYECKATPEECAPVQMQVN